jgi:protein-S-isoprenylcysteine O-methyltransferase Ste14
MKDFLDYLKWKPTWIGILVFSVLFFLLSQAYVYPTMTFDFSVIYKWETWFSLILVNVFMTIFNYLWFGRYNKDKFKKEKPQFPEVPQ